MWEFWVANKTTNSSGSFWSADWGGYLNNVTGGVGFFGQPFPDWGATATSLLLAGGLMVLRFLYGILND